MEQSVEWTFIVKKRLSWISEMLQVSGTAKHYFKEAIGVNFEFRNAQMLLFYEFLDAHELQTFDDLIAYEFQRNNNYLHQVAQRCYSICSQFTSIGKKIAAENWTHKSHHELLTALNSFHQQALLMIPVVYFEPDLSDNIRTWLQKKLRARDAEAYLEEYFLLLTSTTKELTIVKEQRDLLSIGATIQKLPSVCQKIIESPPQKSIVELPTEILSKLTQHIHDYAWINTDDMFGRPWTELDLIARLQYLLRKDCQVRLHKAKERQRQRDQQREQLIADLPVDGELLRLVEAAQENSYLRTYRTEVYIRTLYQASQLIDAVARRVELTYEHALYFSLDELIQALSANVPISQRELEQRKAGMAYRMIDRKLETFFGEKAHALAKKAGLFEQTFPNITHLEGNVANMGIVRGTVRVLHDISELSKIEDGDILVASMTIPEFVPAMERASAFVTDEGGITCHAAIVSREMDIPCIIGTDIATKMLKDGDFVEVDANEGLVKLLHAFHM